MNINTSTTTPRPSTTVRQLTVRSTCFTSILWFTLFSDSSISDCPFFSYSNFRPPRSIAVSGNVNAPRNFLPVLSSSSTSVKSSFTSLAEVPSQSANTSSVREGITTGGRYSSLSRTVVSIFRRSSLLSDFNTSRLRTLFSLRNIPHEVSKAIAQTNTRVLHIAYPVLPSPHEDCPHSSPNLSLRLPDDRHYHATAVCPRQTRITQPISSPFSSLYFI